MHSPMTQLLGVSIILEEHGHVVLTATPQHRFKNGVNIMHGGYAASLLDHACGAAAQSVLDDQHYCLTLELKVSYLRKIEVETGPLNIIGRVQKPGRQIMFCEGVLQDADGHDLATATSTLMVRPIEHQSEQQSRTGSQQ
ncbi:uncharacterized protein (TIGR00369 family) [Novosphingobium sp. GV079]|nr:uncharacterized protein (TIGR00369 family) [Novosphingobium sp. GV079]PUB38046.1 uncharacterized protein (TIGR00369 family) [Novosphingobium sp. GV027]